MKPPLNIAHRGLSSQYPENTLLAFEKGMEAGADGFECDLRLTSDGKVVVFHDDDLQRLCGVSGSIEHWTWADIKKLRVNGLEKIPSLEDVLMHFLTTTINLELKPSSREDVLVEAVLRVLTKARPRGRILFSSFLPGILDCLQKMDENRKMGSLGVLVESRYMEKLPESLERWKPDTWNVPKQILDQPWLERWKSVKIPPLWVWTLDEADQWEEVLHSGLPFEAIITNKSEALATFLASKSHTPSRG